MCHKTLIICAIKTDFMCHQTVHMCHKNGLYVPKSTENRGALSLMRKIVQRCVPEHRKKYGFLKTFKHFLKYTANIEMRLI